MLKIFGPVIANLVGSEVKAATEKAKRSAICYGIVTVTGFIGLIFLLIAAYHALSAHLGPLRASLVIAGASIVIALITLLINALLEKARQRQLEQRRAAIDANAALTAAAVASVPILLKKPLLATALPILGVIAFGLLARSNKSNEKTDRDPAKQI